ncbi:MAG: hypothetical protein JRN27_00305 [Nitrososphaerota archaeon]|nr:hypothetical protein [Nitrososphaerota archaeon]MDG6974522.1 hypothetical protein [Nitrososphaerota archaeon]MDG7009468.1 hypothetical protein [Nitrososphaerota archaeon]MDG7019112.1 hypothetical protein [Nitrososphaerota archaeon]
MDLTELEVEAGRLLDEQRRLRAIDAELEALSQEIKQDPKRNEKDKAFYALIGMDWSDPGHQDRASVLRKEKESARRAIGEVQHKVLEGLSSSGLVIPLDPSPSRSEGTNTFGFRSGATFPKTVEGLSAILGIPSPLKIGDVTIYGDRVEVADSDEYFAKKKLVDAFDDVRKAVRRRLASQPEGKL